MMNMNNYYPWFILAIFILLPSFLVFAWTWRWWEKGRYSFDKFDHPGRRGDYDFNSGYIYPFGPHRGIPPKNYHRDDKRIVDEISDRLMAHGLIDVSEVEVSCDNGLVTLEGAAEDRRSRRIIEDVVDSVVGVLDVNNHLQIHSRVYSKMKRQHAENILSHH